MTNGIPNMWGLVLLRYYTCPQIYFSYLLRAAFLYFHQTVSLHLYQLINVVTNTTTELCADISSKVAVLQIAQRG